MESKFLEELERILVHTWCYDVRQDYILNRLWNDEKAVQFSMAMGMRKWLDLHEHIRVWVEVPHTYRKGGRKVTKKRDLVVVRLLPEYDHNEKYYYGREVPNEEIMICEIKYTGNKKSAIDSDIQYLMDLMERNEKNLLFVFAWLSWEKITGKNEKMINELIEKTKEMPLKFLVGRCSEPFRWGYYANGVEQYYVSSEQQKLSNISKTKLMKKTHKFPLRDK